MICPKCQKESLNFQNCPYCNTPLVAPKVEEQPVVQEVQEEPVIEEIIEESTRPQNTEALRKKLKIFYICVIAIGIVVLILLIINLFKKNTKPKEIPPEETTTTVRLTTQYVNSRASMRNPYGLDTEFKSSLYDENSKKYYDVTVKGIRLLDSAEINSLLNANGITYEVFEGFALKGIVYSVHVDDLDGSISPALMGTFYKTSTMEDFVKINGENKKIDVKSIANENISSGETKEVSVIYQTKDDDYSICLGNAGKAIGCIRP